MTYKQIKIVAVCAVVFWSLLLLVASFSRAGVVNFSWRYTTAEQEQITKFRIVMDGGTNVVIDDISPDKRTASFDLVSINEAHSFGVYACNEKICSDLSDIIIYNPVTPPVVGQFLITVEAVQ